VSLQDFYSLKAKDKPRSLQLTEEEMDVLNRYAATIIRIYQLKTDNETNEISTLKLDDITVVSVFELRKELIKISDKITKSKEVGLHPVQAFLTKFPPGPYRYFDNWCLLQARVLIICHHFYTQKNYKDIIIRVMTSCRQFINTHNKMLVAIMPSFDIELENLIEELVKLKESFEQGESNITRVGNVIRLLSDYKLNKKEYKKRNKGRGTGEHKDPEITIKPPKYATEEDEDKVIEMGQAAFDNDNYDYNFLEREAEQTPVARLFSVDLVAPGDVKKSLTKQNILANASINHILRREKYLTSDVNQLTSYEVSVLVKYCFEQNVSSVEANYIFLSLITGRSLEQILSPDFHLKKFAKQPFNNRLVVVFEPVLPEHKQPKKRLKLITPSTGSVQLSLPKVLSDCLQKRDSKSTNSHHLKEKISSKITQLNKKHSCRITQARIANFLATFLQQHGADSVETAMILGWNPKQVAGSYYYQVSSERLLLLHQKYLIYLYQVAGKEYVDIIKTKDKGDENYNDNRLSKQQEADHVGSKLQVKAQYIGMLFSKLEEELASTNYDLNEFHNLYTIHTLLLLNLALGHRPVKNPYESADIFDIHASTVYLCDKESRSTLSARVLVLPDVALEQIKKYISHLQVLSLKFSNISPELEKQIIGAKIGKEPLFFFIDEDKITPVIPTNLQYKLNSIFPLALNWHRHYMRTALRKSGISGQLVDLMMGHNGIGNTDMSKFSALSMSDLRNVASTINTHLIDDLKIKSVEGLREHYG